MAWEKFLLETIFVKIINSSQVQLNRGNRCRVRVPQIPRLEPGIYLSCADRAAEPRSNG